MLNIRLFAVGYKPQAAGFRLLDTTASDNRKGGFSQPSRGSPRSSPPTTHVPTNNRSKLLRSNPL